jgi:hypothetical protein
MSGFTGENRSTLYRWGISIALALAVHAGIATVVLLNWPKAVEPPPLPGAVVVDLAPEPGNPPAPVSEPQPAPAPSASQAARDRSPDQVDKQSEEKTAAKSEPKLEPKVESKPVEGAPAVTPPEPVPAGTPDSRDNMQAGAAPAAGAGGGPIDLRIAEQRRDRFRKAAKGHDWKTAIMPRAPKAAFAGRHPAASPGTPGGVARNAIGMVVPDRVGTNGMMTPSAATHTGSPLAVNGVNGTATVTTNAIGLGVTSNPRVTGVAAPRPAIGPVASIGGLNGTSMVRPGAGASSLGGPSKTVAGVINGTSIKPRP